MAKKQVIKVVLSTGKVVLLRTLQISDTETAAQQVAVRANGDSNLLQMFMQKALLQLLLVSSEEKILTPNDKEDLDALFSVSEYSQLLKVIGKLMGSDDMGKEPKVEFQSSED